MSSPKIGVPSGGNLAAPALFGAERSDRTTARLGFVHLTISTTQEADHVIRSIQLCQSDAEPNTGFGGLGLHPAHLGPARVRNRIRQDADELVATVAHHKILATKPRLEGGCEFAQQLIPRLVAPLVVGQLESVQVDESHREGSLLSPSPVNFALQSGHPGGAPENPGEVIEGCLLAEFEESPGAQRGQFPGTETQVVGDHHPDLRVSSLAGLIPGPAE